LLDHIKLLTNTTILRYRHCPRRTVVTYVLALYTWRLIVD
jgi:hypothetical protein